MPVTEEIVTTTRPTSSEMRAPARMRARMSRPSSSRPRGCDRLGTFEPPGQLLRVRIVGRQEWSCDRGEDSERNDDDTDADHQSYRIRGSSSPYVRSVSRFMSTYVTEMNRMQPCTSG